MKTFQTKFRGNITTWEILNVQGNHLYVVRKAARLYGLPSRPLWVMRSTFDGEYKTCRGSAYFSLGEEVANV